MLTPKKITGRFLNHAWSIGVKHVLYSCDGRYFHALTKFPGALCDAEGYVRFETKQQFEACEFLKQVGKRNIGCDAGIRYITGYVRCEWGVATDVDVENATRSGGSKRMVQTISRIVRDTAVGGELKLLYDHSCQLCGGSILLAGRRYCEAHHIRPLGRPHNGDDVPGNVVCVCPNCHVRLDYAAIPLAAEDFKHLKHKIDPRNIDYHNALHVLVKSGLKVGGNCSVVPQAF